MSARDDLIPVLAEVFRELGYEGASLSQITARTGLGKGSLYHLFPGGKEEMATAVVRHIDHWFEVTLYQPLKTAPPRPAIAAMWQTVDAYFHSGGRICLVGAFALDDTRDHFADLIRDYFQRWVAALGNALERAGMSQADATEHAEAAVAGLQGALVLARAVADPAVFGRSLERLKRTLENALPSEWD